MRYVLMTLALLIAGRACGQVALPAFLQGTWKGENREIYEHWDQLNETSMKGFAYVLEDGQMRVLEYLAITQQGKVVVLNATVKGQHQGAPISFRLTRSDDAFVFENPQHDFPKRIIYAPTSASEMTVTISDGAQKHHTVRMTKQHVKRANDSTTSNPDYDRALAERLGADDYGMKGYMLVILKTGGSTRTDKAFVSERFRGHLQNINRLAEEGKLIVAGPLGQNERGYRGIFILHVTDAEEAKALLRTDPAIEAGLLDFELYNWYGSAALPEYLDAADKIWRKKP